MRSPKRETHDALDWSLRLALKGMVARYCAPRELRSAVMREARSLERLRQRQPTRSVWLRDLGLIGGEPRVGLSPQISLEPFATSLGVFALRR
jgi:hypothetical protein